MEIIIPVAILAGIGLIASIVLVIASKFMAVKVDQKQIDLREALPGANCGACGFAGCDEYAAKLAAGEAQPNLCVPGGAGVAQKLGEILGVDVGDVESLCAVVQCNGCIGATDTVMDYQGPKSCSACKTFFQGSGACKYGCMGYGDCVAACQYNAIQVLDGVAKVDRSLCVGCGMCAKACPNGLIAMVPISKTVAVCCSNKEKGAIARKVCKNSCIGCKKCERNCPSNAIHVVDNLARIDYSLCTNCNTCVEQCPTGAIHTLGCLNQ